MEKFKTKIIGQGKKTMAVVACLHGDEIIGKHVHEWLIENQNQLKCKIKLIFGNSAAYIKNVRFIDENLNRVFPGKEYGNYEEKQAFRIMEDLKGADIVLDIHSTTSDISPFVIYTWNVDNKNLIKSTGLKNVLFYTSGKSYSGQTLGESLKVPSIAIECGQHKKEETLKNGINIMENILRHYGFLQGNAKYVKQNFFKTDGIIIESEKDMNLSQSIEDFQLIKSNTVIAEGNNSIILAKNSFYPILISKTGKREEGVLMLISQKINMEDQKN